MNFMLSLYLKFNQKGGEMMAVIYATLIIKGKKTLDRGLKCASSRSC